MLSIFKRSNQTSERQLRKYRKIVQQINKLEATYEAMSDEQLASMTDTFKEKIQSGETLQSITPTLLQSFVKHPNEYLVCVISMFS